MWIFAISHCTLKNILQDFDLLQFHFCSVCSCNQAKQNCINIFDFLFPCDLAFGELPV